MDARLVANGRGIEVDEAAARLKTRLRLDEIQEQAQRLYPELVAIRWEQGRAVAQFEGRAPEGALDLLRGSGAEVASEVVVSSRSELHRQQVEVGNSLTAMGVTDWAVAIDPAGERIVASVGIANGARMADGKAISEQSILANLPADLSAANVDVQVVNGPVSHATTTYGGTDARIGGAFQCTNAFTVTGPGIVTAGHCGNAINSYRDWVTGIIHTATFQSSHHNGPFGDWEWFTTTGTEVDDFYSDELGNRRDVASVAGAATKGADVVWFGRKTKNNWISWVEYPLVNTTGPDRLACMFHGRVDGGDSGGPVYIVSTAVGVMWGWINIDGAKRDCYSQATYSDDAMGVFIKTQ